jgi:hypothetical protein
MAGKAHEREERRAVMLDSVGEAAAALALASGQGTMAAAAASRTARRAVDSMLDTTQGRARVLELSGRVQALTFGRAREILDATIGSEMRSERGCGVEALYPHRCAASSVASLLLKALPIFPEVPRLVDTHRRVCRVTAVNKAKGWSVAPGSASVAAAASREPAAGATDIALVPSRIGEMTGLVFDAPGEFTIAYEPLGNLCDQRHSAARGHGSAGRASESRRPCLTVGVGGAVNSARRGDGPQLWVDARPEGGVLRLRWTTLTEEELDASPEEWGSIRHRCSRWRASELVGKLELISDTAPEQSVFVFVEPGETPRITIAWLSCSITIEHSCIESAGGDGATE